VSRPAHRRKERRFHGAPETDGRHGPASYASVAPTAARRGRDEPLAQTAWFRARIPATHRLPAEPRKPDIPRGAEAVRGDGNSSRRRANELSSQPFAHPRFCLAATPQLPTYDTIRAARKAGLMPITSVRQHGCQPVRYLRVQLRGARDALRDDPPTECRNQKNMTPVSRDQASWRGGGRPVPRLLLAVAENPPRNAHVPLTCGPMTAYSSLYVG
jgi:hypothetical protein